MKTCFLTTTLILSLVALNAQSDDTNAFTMAQTISDGAQRTTLAFSGLAIMTGTVFFPAGQGGRLYRLPVSAR